MKKITNPLYEGLHRGIYSKLVYKTFKRQKKCMYWVLCMFISWDRRWVFNHIQPYLTSVYTETQLLRI